MSKAGDLIWVDGMADLKVAFQKSAKEIEEACMTEYKRISQDIIGEAQRNLKRNGSNTTGVLSRSGKVQMVDETTLDVGFFEEGGYAFFVEYGRRSGKFPPPNRLREWLRKKNSNGRGGNILDLKRQDYDRWLDSVAYLIGRKIARQGSKPHPFFTPAVQKYKGQIKKALTGAINKVTR